MRNNFTVGAFVGAALTMPLVAAAYVGWKTFDLPFAPFDVFDWMTRALPGSLATFAIDVMIRGASVLHVGTAGTAKLVEQSLAIGFLLCAGGLAGGVLCALLGASREPASLLGAVLGAALGGAVLLVEQDLNRLTSPGAFASGVAVFVPFFCWGVAFGWLCDRVREAETREADEDGIAATRERRSFLARLAGVTASLTVFGAVWGALAGRTRQSDAGERWSADHQLPNAGASVAPVPGTRPELTPIERHYRIDAVTRAPALSGARWRLRVGGLVDRPLELTLDELRAREPLHQFVTLACISNPVGGDLIGTTRWTGVSLQRLVSEWRLGPSASHVKLVSADGFTEVVALDTIRADPRVMLTYAWDGVPLPIEHGFPLRLYVPDLYGMKQPKWIQAIDVLDHWEPGYWVQRGWDREGRMKSAAVIDTVAAENARMNASGERLVPVGGIAHAGARGVSTVEVQVDEGLWQPAALRDPLSDTTWVIWRAEVSLTAGDHILAVRAHERNGTLQTSPPHTKRVRV